jgi:Ca2+-binding EF-hand superfamily protein
MKRTYLFAAGAVCATVLALNAQDKPADSQGQRRERNPIIAALDANGDGVIDANEINNAPSALRKLDKNGDGKLTREELRGERGQRNGGNRRQNGSSSSSTSSSTSSK